MQPRDATILGPVLIIVGLLLLLAQLGFPAFGVLWPLFPLAVGIGFLLRYAQRRDDSSLVFAGVLLLQLSALFQFRQWELAPLSEHWPFFTLAVGIAFLVRVAVDREARDSLLPGVLLTLLGILFYLFSFGFFAWILRSVYRVLRIAIKIGVPLGLIGWGAWMLIARRGAAGGSSNEAIPEKIEPPVDDR